MTDPHIRSFDSIEEMFTWIKERNDAATAVLHDKQKAITFGSHVICYQHEILIFGKVYDRDSFFRDNECYALEETQEEWLQIEAEDAIGRSYGNYYSVVEPRGEVGSNHKLNLWPIHEDIFTQAQEYAWEPRMFPEPLWNECFGAVKEMTLHLMSVRS